MGNDSYALTNMNLFDIPVEVAGERASVDWFVYFDKSKGQWRRALMTTATGTELNYLDITTLGTGAASKAVVLDASGDYTYPASATIVYPSGATLTLQSGSTFNAAGTFQVGGVAVTATAAEINNICDISTRIITIADGTNTLALTQATHANRLVKVMDATLAITLPEATGTGDVYTIIQGIAATSSTIVTADTANCGFHGFIMGSDTDAAGNYNWIATGTQDTITYNGTSTGGKLYDWIRVTDVATDAWLLEGNIKQSGGSEATPLSSAA